MSVGFSGAALATFVNEAAINALRRNAEIIELQDFIAVRQKSLDGQEKKCSVFLMMRRKFKPIIKRQRRCVRIGLR
ncbi:MAG: hypothetical protein LRY68_09420 [Sulfurospirillum sp.]|nr:hypothetical protein [Sulfurospirillum sp.]